jgi:hypothetical protein
MLPRRCLGRLEFVLREFAQPCTQKPLESITRDHLTLQKPLSQGIMLCPAPL